MWWERRIMSERCLEFEQKVDFGGFNNTGYAGGFPSRVEKRIKRIVKSPCLHLFSGSSLIGDERVDINQTRTTTWTEICFFWYGSTFFNNLIFNRRFVFFESWKIIITISTYYYITF